MNQFERGLAQAKRQQRLIYAGAGLLIVGAELPLAGFLLSEGGTPIVAAPDDAEKTARVSGMGGMAVSIDNVVYSLSDGVRVKVAAIGFKPAERVIERHETGQNVTAILTELPAKLSVTTTPEGDKTRWLIDDILVHVGPNLIREVVPGN